MKRLAAVFLFACAVPAGADIGAGNWEMDVTSSIAGSPAGNMKQTQCLTAEDARDPSRMFGTPGAGCQFSNRQDNGSTYQFDISCTGATPMTGRGEMRYGQDSLNGELVLHLKLEGKDTELRSSIKAKRLGPSSK
jgi:hypothetical protein